MRQLRIGLALKLAGGLAIGAIAFSALFGWINLGLQKRRFEQMVVLSAERIADVIERSARFSMERNDRVALYRLIRDMGQEQGVVRLRIFNEQGLIRFSTDPAEVNTAVDKQAEQCFACHAREQPLARLSRPDHARTFRTPSGERVVAVIRPIENRPDCSNAACHAHPPDRRILGVIDTHLSLTGVDTQLAEHQRELILASAGAAALLCGAAWIFVWLFVHRPIRRLTEATEEVAGGALAHRIEIESSDELGRLAESFNEMTVELERAHAELTRWAQTLEERVERKSEELRRARDSLVASENLASLGKLAATVAHEVNNPLFGMLTYARLSQRTISESSLDVKTKQQVAEYLHIIERESKRCGDILRSLLEFARHGTNASTAPRYAETDLNGILDRALKLVAHRLELEQVEVEKKLAQGAPPVYCDAAQVEQGSLALIINAIEAMPQGGMLRIATEYDTIGEVFHVRIGDTGSGISAENLKHIFEPFFTTKDFRHSTGLGLPIAKGIIERHGGHLEVESAPGRGTEFQFTIPMTRAGAPARTVPATETPTRAEV